MRTEEYGRGVWGAICLRAKRFAATELTCSQLLNSSAMASSLSIWGRWISLTLHWNIAHTPGCLPAAPFLFLVF